jgi:hypothetical protein
MSQAQTPDEAALASFKACFGYRAKPIKSAFKEVARLKTAIVDQEKIVAAATLEQEAAKKDRDSKWKALEEVRSRGKNPTASDKQVAAQDRLDTADKDLPVQQKALDSLKVQLAAAEKQKTEKPKEAIKDYFAEIAQRLKAAGKTNDDLDRAARTEFTDAAKAGDAGRIEAAVTAIDLEMKRVVGPFELAQKQTEVAGRLQVLNARLYKDTAALDQIAILAQGATIETLTGDVERKLAVAEGDVARLESAAKDARETLDAVIASAALKQTDFDALNKRFEGLDDKARIKPDAAVIVQFEALADDVRTAQSVSDKAKDFRDDYETRLPDVAKFRADFPTMTPLHKGFKLGKVDVALKDAATFFASRDFDTAVAFLTDADDLLTDMDARARTMGSDQAKDVAAAAALKKKKADDAVKAAAAKKKAASDLAAAEGADSISALAAIGRDNQFGKWMVKVEALIVSGKITVTAGAPYDLNPNQAPGENQTIEIMLTIVPTGPGTLAVRTFVVHYHPQAKKPTTENPDGSQMHVKPHPGNSLTSRTALYEGHWLRTMKIVPGFGAIKSQFGA